MEWNGIEGEERVYSSTYSIFRFLLPVAAHLGGATLLKMGAEHL